tara:strand:- start:284 stop:526 length:243 start_codon:yes stop_codon:yes gene_type:complete
MSLKFLPADRTDRILDGIGLAVRNHGINECWQMLSKYTDKTYREKLDIITDRYFVGDKSIEHIIRKCQQKQDTLIHPIGE